MAVALHTTEAGSVVSRASCWPASAAQIAAILCELDDAVHHVDIGEHVIEMYLGAGHVQLGMVHRDRRSRLDILMLFEGEGAGVLEHARHQVDDR
jgi:hypothetical protein